MAYYFLGRPIPCFASVDPDYYQSTVLEIYLVLATWLINVNWPP